MSDEAEARRSRATAEMVAKLANVSRVAVSRAFNPEASLRADKRARILSVARELNYTPDRAARALVTRRSHLIGMIVPDVFSPWESQEVDALTSALQAEGFATLLFKTRTDMSMDERLLTYMRGFNPDSVIAFTENVRPEVLSQFLDSCVPIYINYLLEDGGAVEAEAPTDVLYDRLDVNQWQGMDQAVALLAGYGCRRIAYISGKKNSLAEFARYRTLQRLMARRKLPAPTVVQGDFSYRQGYAATIDLFRLHGGADAIFAANDESAFGALDALRHELGLGVPDAVRVVGFDDIVQSGWKSYDLTTVRIDVNERVSALVRLILRRLSAPDAPTMSEQVGTKLVVRGTVG